MFRAGQQRSALGLVCRAGVSPSPTLAEMPVCRRMAGARQKPYAAPMTLTCLCSRTRIETALKPDHINDCNCRLCSGTGALWAYYRPEDVTIEGQTQVYVREDKAEPGAAVHFCPNCGSTTHFRLTPAMVAKVGDVQMGVNMRLADEADLAGVEVRFPDGRSWPGHGTFGHRRPARVIGQE